MKPLFSIVLSTYNRAGFLPVTIGFIQAQDFTDFELLIVDDGSKDNTREVIDALMQTDKRIKYIYQDNAERGAARNKGFRASDGQYVLFFDSDDEMKKDHLRVLKNAIDLHPEYEIFATKFAFKQNAVINSAPIMKSPEGGYGLDFVLTGNPLGTLFCFKKNAEGITLFPEDRELATMEDWICLMQNLDKRPVYLINKVTVYVINHSGRSMAQNQLVIKRRLQATEEIIKTTRLNSLQQKTLWAYSYYFCAVHAYLDFNRKQALAYIKKSLATGGIKKEFIIAVIKILVGKKIINKIANKTK